ncbi:hypothetical protein [Pseudoalteromonas carrageenovora]|nr:hypothetical protein [Pseudoalteromonas carrageenovora]MDO6830247.1 hypothetical protein [Pseudoalteromonas carrageenovora]
MFGIYVLLSSIYVEKPHRIGSAQPKNQTLVANSIPEDQHALVSI